jgi:hypothetical protein
MHHLDEYQVSKWNGLATSFNTSEAARDCAAGAHGPVTTPKGIDIRLARRAFIQPFSPVRLRGSRSGGAWETSLAQGKAP